MSQQDFSEKKTPPKYSEKEIRYLVDNVAHFVAIAKYEYNIELLMKEYPDGATNKVIASALAISESEVDRVYKRAVKKLREAMLVSTEVDDE